MTRAGRRIGLFAAAAVAIVLGTALALGLYSARHLERAIERFESEAGSLDLGTYDPPRVERRENAALWLRAGAEALISTPEQNVLLARRAAALGQPWSTEDEESFVALLADHDPARRLMDRAASLERSSFEIDYQRGADAKVPDFLPLLRAARLLAVDCDFRQQRGEIEPALAALHLLERLTAVQRAESLLIALLTGSAVERLYLDRLESMLQVLAKPDALLATRHDLEHLDSATVAPGLHFAAETALAFPWMLGMSSEELPVRVSTYRRALPLPPYLRRIGVDREVAALLLDSGTRTILSVERPAARLEPEEYVQENGVQDSPVPFAARMARVMSMTPNHLGAVQRAQWSESARALGRLAVDLRLSRLGHGRYPDGPIDLPQSVATGETAVYRIFDDGAVEIAFPDAEASWEAEKRSSDQRGMIAGVDFNLRWRLPP